MSDPSSGGPLDWLRSLGRSTPGPVAPDPALPSAGPKVEARPGGQNRYRIDVPSDHTTLSLGRARIGEDSGITGTTSKHVHFVVTDGTPTSLSLGSPRSADGALQTEGFTVETDGEVRMHGDARCLISSRLHVGLGSDEKSVQIGAAEGINTRSNTFESVAYDSSVLRTDNDMASMRLNLQGHVELSASLLVKLVVGKTSVKLSPGSIFLDNGAGATLSLVGDAILINGKDINATATGAANVKGGQSLTLDGGPSLVGHANTIKWNPGA